MSDIILLDLPTDVLSQIFKNLNKLDLSKLMLTCKALRSFITEENGIWRSFDSFLVRNSLNNSQPPLSLYNLCRISYNWRSGVYIPKILNHYTKYIPWLKLHNSEALYLSLGSELRCYPMDNYGLPDKGCSWSVQVPKVKRHDIRTNDVSRFVIKDDIIVCGNRDGCAIVYKFDNLKQRPRLLHHIQDCHENGKLEVSAVEFIKLHDTITVVTVSHLSPTLFYWQICDNKTTNKYGLADYKYHDSSNAISLPNNDGLRCVALSPSQSKLAIGPNGNNKPIFLDVATCNVLSRKDEPKYNMRQAVRDIQWHDENTAVYVTHAGKMQFIDTRTYNVVLNSKDPFLVSLYCVRTDGDRCVVAGSAVYSRCVLFDRRQPYRHLQIYFTQKRSSPVYSLDFDSTKLIAAADGSLATLNFDVTPGRKKVRDYSVFNFDVV